jgi:hypothetical protein
VNDHETGYDWRVMADHPNPDAGLFYVGSYKTEQSARENGMVVARQLLGLKPRLQHWNGTEWEEIKP